MAKLLSHIVAYAAINAFLIAIWVLVGGGSTAELQAVAQDPTMAVKLGFWPVWPILVWGVLLVMHAGSTLSNIAFGREARRQRRRAARRAALAGRDIARDVSASISKAQQRRADREARREERPSTPAPPSAPVTPLTATAEPVTPPSARKWVTVMFSDIADSTKLNEELGDEEWHRVLRRVRTIVRSALRARGGDEVGTQGDGALARFSSPADAVLCAVDIQENLKAARATGSVVPELRIGVHAGEAVEDEGDLVGHVINLASRVTSEAEPGEILVTEPVADQLVGRLELEDKGLRSLKGLSQPRHLLAVRWSQEAQ
jgi:class 3 adenylate cyclase